VLVLVIDIVKLVDIVPGCVPVIVAIRVSALAKLLLAQLLQTTPQEITPIHFEKITFEPPTPSILRSPTAKSIPSTTTTSASTSTTTSTTTTSPVRKKRCLVVGFYNHGSYGGLVVGFYNYCN